MNELVWEGLLEILRAGEPSLKASAHLWRRDDLSGSDWGGQLELPVVFRRLLPAEEYQVRLPSGIEARVRIAAGPSTTTMTFPTLTGIGHPPFGSAVPAQAAAPAAEAAPAPRATSSGRRAAVETPRATRERTVRNVDAPARMHRASTAAAVPTPEPAPAPAPAPAAAPPASPEPVVPSSAAAPPATVEPPRVAPAPATLEPRTTGRPRTPARARAERANEVQSRGDAHGGAAVEESVEQTEALARAFLAAIEARQTILPLEHAGFEGRAIAAARHDVELIAATLESALRSPNGATDWTDELRQRLSVVAWFASLAAPDEQADVAAAGRAVLDLLNTVEALLAIRAESFGPQLEARAA